MRTSHGRQVSAGRPRARPHVAPAEAFAFTQVAPGDRASRLRGLQDAGGARDLDGARREAAPRGRDGLPRVGAASVARRPAGRAGTGSRGRG